MNTEIANDVDKTPRQFMIDSLCKSGMTRSQSEEQWLRLEAYCMKKIDETEDYGAMLFDAIDAAAATQP